MRETISARAYLVKRRFDPFCFVAAMYCHDVVSTLCGGKLRRNYGNYDFA